MRRALHKLRLANEMPPFDSNPIESNEEIVEKQPLSYDNEKSKRLAVKKEKVEFDNNQWV